MTEVETSEDLLSNDDLKLLKIVAEIDSVNAKVKYFLKTDISLHKLHNLNLVEVISECSNPKCDLILHQRLTECGRAFAKLCGWETAA